MASLPVRPPLVYHGVMLLWYKQFYPKKTEDKTDSTKFNDEGMYTLRYANRKQNDKRGLYPENVSLQLDDEDDAGYGIVSKLGWHHNLGKTTGKERWWSVGDTFVSIRGHWANEATANNDANFGVVNNNNDIANQGRVTTNVGHTHKGWERDEPGQHLDVESADLHVQFLQENVGTCADDTNHQEADLPS